MPNYVCYVIHRLQRCQIAAPRWPNDNSSAADNMIFKNRSENIEGSFGCMARSAVLLKPNVANILLFNFCEQKFIQHGPLTVAIDCNDLSLLILEENWPNYVFGPKSAPNTDLFWVHRLINVCVRGFCAPNATILLVYIPPRSKWALSSSSSVSRSQALLTQRSASVCTIIFVRRKDKTNYLSNQTLIKCYHSRNNH